MLDSQSYIAVGVETSSRAFEVLQGVRVDVLLIGLTQCEREGTEIVNAAKNVQPGLKVIVASGIGQWLSSYPSVDLFLRKPFSLDQLHVAMDQLLSNRAHSISC